MERLVQGKELDPFYLSRLSIDAIPETVKIFQMNVVVGGNVKNVRN